MTELQRIFLVYTGMYFVVLGAMYLAFHVALIMLEREARIKHAKCKVFVAKKRAEEQERWKTAYDLYYKKHQAEAPQMLKSAI
ncbi:MAG: hypothetical protein GXY49_05295 [Syntrophomonadaceae bacterium]|nr:hypothetical protein [Syntrophomonadaceae bacterium]